MEKFKTTINIFKWVAVVLFATAICFCISRDKYEKHKNLYDTITIYDTTFVVKPIFRDSVVTHYVTKVLQVDSTSYRDSTIIHDSVAVRIPITSKTYSDSSYRAVVSGYMPSLDTLFIYQKERLVLKENKPKRWSFGVSGGYGITPKGFQPYIGVSINFRLK